MKHYSTEDYHFPELIPYPHTDTGNAERLVAVFGKHIRHCREFRKWLAWDEKWLLDAEFQVQAMAKKVARALYAQASKLPDAKHRDDVQGFARSSESAARIRATLECAKSEKGIPVSPRDFDRDPWLLNCQNGTLNLKLERFEFRPASPDDLVTKTCGVKFDPDAKCPQFRAFLNRIFGGNASLISYVQRAIGYALTGAVGEKAIFFLFGDGNNGKTTLLEIIRHVLGDYAGQIMIESLLDSNRFYQTTAMADLADLLGIRFVTTSEADQDVRLAEAQIKQLTGMGQLKGCRKYENPFTFDPTHKIFMDSNYRPEIRGTDTAIWERVKAIPFTEEIPRAERDKHLLEKLRSEGPGILRWAVEGCYEWQESGLGEPLEVAELVREWKGESDPYQPFFDSHCEFRADAKCPAGNLYAAYEKYANEEGIEPNQRQFTESLRRMGCSTDRTNSTRLWRGITLRG